MALIDLSAGLASILASRFPSLAGGETVVSANATTTLIPYPEADDGQPRAVSAGYRLARSDLASDDS